LGGIDKIRRSSIPKGVFKFEEMKNLIKIKWLLFLLLPLWGMKGVAQQDAQFSQYMFNPFVLNPAYAGCREVFTALVINRNQWVTMPGAPNTQSLSLNTPLSKRVGVGFQVFNDMIGPKNTLGYLGTYSYRIPFSNGKLAFGLRAGGLTYNFNWDKIDYKDQDDFYNQYNRLITTVFNADGGIFYNTKTFYTGLSINHLGYTRQIMPIKIQGIGAHLQMHFFYTIGNTFEINDQFAFQPSLLIKSTPMAPLNADLNMNVLIDKRMWFGVSIRSRNAVVFLTQFIVSDNFRFGYSYDYGINMLERLSRGSHEIFLGFDFRLKNIKSISPRYF
jgi:type IX secretion system PorP/SprF family membrane protein